MRRLALFLCAASLTTGCVSIGIATLERDEIETAKRDEIETAKRDEIETAKRDEIETAKRASAWARSPEAILRRQATMK